MPRMKHNEITGDDKKRGHIIMMSSRSAERPLPKLVTYASAKGAVEKLMEGARTEYSCYGIAFTLVNPGSVNTAFTEKWNESVRIAHNNESMNVKELMLTPFNKVFKYKLTK